MKTSHQEKILEIYHSFEAVKDCFAISRLQTEINGWSGPAAFNTGARNQMQMRQDEIDKILAKYPDAFSPSQPRP